jgi:large subunit ribosomal protein L5
MKTLQEKQSKVFESLASDLGLANVMEAPSVEKIVVNVGTGSRAKKDRFANEYIAGELAKITGQQPSARMAKQSIAGFKIRQGDHVGQSVTLRGEQMRSFFDKLVNIALPRTKDFRGIDPKGVDQMGNLTIGIKEHTIFPETGDEELHKIFGLSVTIVTTAKNREDAVKYFTYLGVPFKKEKTA